MDKNEVEKLAKLARINLKDDEKSRLSDEFGQILDYVKEIESVSLDSQPHTAATNEMRDDENPHESGKFSKIILANAPSTEDNYIKVKKII